MRLVRGGSATRDMTEGSIVKQVLLFAVPLMLGNVFQMLYNTVDSIVVGNYVSTQALAAINSTSMIVNIQVFFFNGFSVGAGVVISRHFGARQLDALHTAVETTMAAAFAISILFTAIGIIGVRPMLQLMSTPDDVFDDAVTYLTIYFAGISGLLVYNICSGILRAVGDTTRPLMFLVLTSVMNIILDLFCVLVLKLGIAGAAYATIFSQFISAFLCLRLITRTDDIYKFTWKDMRIDPPTLREIFAVALPTGIQSVITSVSNVFVQSYINYFGSACMAGWGCYNKLDQFIMLPMQSLAMSATTFVSQNMGAKKEARANRGAIVTIALTLGITGCIALGLYLFASQSTSLFTNDPEVIDHGILFIRTNIFFLLFNCVNHVLAGALRGRRDATGPMVIMLMTFVGVRQVYLFCWTRFVSNTPQAVGFGYPVGWMTCCAIEVTYALIRIRRETKKEKRRAIEG